MISLYKLMIVILRPGLRKVNYLKYYKDIKNQWIGYS